MAKEHVPKGKELAALVAHNIKIVRDEYQKAQNSLRSSWFGGEEAKNASKGIQSLLGKIETWAARGMAGAAINKSPATTGWNTWVKTGRIYVDGIHDIAEIGDKAVLKNIVTSIKELPEDTTKAVASAAKFASTTVASTAGAIVKPLAIPLTITIIGGIVVAYMAYRFKLI